MARSCHCPQSTSCFGQLWLPKPRLLDWTRPLWMPHYCTQRQDGYTGCCVLLSPLALQHQCSMLQGRNSSLQGSLFVHSEYWVYPPPCLPTTRGPPSVPKTVNRRTRVEDLNLGWDGSEACRSQTCPAQRTPAEYFSKKLARLPSKPKSQKNTITTKIPPFRRWWNQPKWGVFPIVCVCVCYSMLIYSATRLRSLSRFCSQSGVNSGSLSQFNWLAPHKGHPLSTFWKS